VNANTRYNELLQQNSKQKILVVYLETGSGHITAAKIIKHALDTMHGDEAETMILNGFSPKQFVCRAFFERGYHAGTVIIRGGFSLLYNITMLAFMRRLLTYFVSINTKPYLMRVIRKNHITKVVSVHFVLTPVCRAAIDRINPNIPLSVMIMDPFTIHPAWCEVKNAHFVVFSKESKEYIIKNHGVSDSKVFPFPLKEEFDVSNNAENSSDKKNFNVLIAGGGEGLPAVIPLIQYFGLKQLAIHADKRLSISVVCGKNKSAYQYLSSLLKITELPIHIYGYVKNMPELLAQSDCVITKGGPAMVMETLALQKPLIISTYIRQELGNVRFVTQNGAGWFIQKPRAIYKKLMSLASNPGYASHVTQNAKRLNIKADNKALCDYIISL
jgi:processive 1,2-diacylglycerol beta-glucosyltransferase/1,2-diacylglycerol 3-beta-galactosyltransferase